MLPGERNLKTMLKGAWHRELTLKLIPLIGVSKGANSAHQKQNSAYGQTAFLLQGDGPVLKLWW